MVVLLIPAYNEASALQTLLAELPRQLHGRAVAVVVVSDGSTDATAEVARAAGAEVVELSTNRGKTAALRAGLAALRDRPFECVVLLDGDGQHDPADLPALTEPVLAGGLDIVCGSRWVGQRGRGHVPVNRYLVRRVVVRLLQVRLDAQITDPFCGYRCLSRRVALTWHPSTDRYEAELELLFDAALNGWRIEERRVARIYAGDCSKMRATEGRIGGRVRVVRQYARIIARKSDELASRAPPRELGRPAGVE